MKLGSTLRLVGGIRTLTMSPSAHFTGPVGGQLADIDVRTTQVAGVEFLIKPWIGLAVGYNALRIDTGNVPKSGSNPVNDVQYAVTQSGPAFSMTFHWSEK